MNDLKKTDECMELKNIKYKTMLLNGKTIPETKSVDNIYNLDIFLENEKNNNKNENWSKLREYRRDLYELEGFCQHLIILLEEHDGGPNGETCMLIYKMDVLKDLDELEDKL